MGSTFAARRAGISPETNTVSSNKGGVAHTTRCSLCGVVKKSSPSVFRSGPVRLLTAPLKPKSGLNGPPVQLQTMRLFLDGLFLHHLVQDWGCAFAVGIVP